MKYELRKYQEDAVASGVEHLLGNNNSGALIVAPTGSGKSIIIAEICHRVGGKVLVIQPSQEILFSNYEKMISYVNPSEVGIFSASCGRKDISTITFVTPGSIINKLDMFENFDFLICDEAHITNAKGGIIASIIDHFGGKLIGLTATPYRLHAYRDFKTENLSVVAKFLHRTRPRLFSKIIHITQIGDLYRQGFLCPILYLGTNDYHHDEIKLNSTGMDFDEIDLAAYNKAHSIITTTTNIIRNENSKHILVFMGSVSEAAELQHNLTIWRISSAIISAKTPKKERAEIIRSFKNGDIRVVCNFGTLTTGFDFPELDCVILGRPTQSVALYYQMIGRGIRIAPKKTQVRIIDICGNVKRFGKIENFEIVENSPGMHRLKSNTSFLTGFDFYHNEDIEAKNYAGLKEEEFKRNDDIVRFGKWKGTHVAKIPNDYLEWACQNISGNWKKIFEKEKERRDVSRVQRSLELEVPF